MRNLFILLILLNYSIQAQQTVGLFQNDSASFNGYTLISPLNYSKSYLIDNCGKEVHQWTGTGSAGAVAYLLPNGKLLRAEKVAGQTFSSGGGVGGRLLMMDENSTQLWNYNCYSTNFQQHHDVKILPNGNVLAICWELKTTADAIQAGRDPATIPTSGIWSEKIIELQQTGLTTATVVWEWHLWDHLVQDFDNTKSNFGVVSNSRQLINANFNTSGGQSDWIHLNAIDYNPALDQIVMSPLKFDEFWIIDHSTTTAEAASHSGGIRGKGGDILYRWGNPQSYNLGTTTDEVFFNAHNVHWIENGLKFQNQIMVYNNGRGRGYSSVDIVNPAIDSNGDYPITSGQAFGPSSLTWSYGNGTTANFYSLNISGAHQLPNGNTIICVGAKGRFFEIDSSQNIVWEYKNPVIGSGPVSQGTTPTQNQVFRAYRYAENYSGLPSSLAPGNPIELNPLSYTCAIVPESVTGINNISLETESVIFPNPASDKITIKLFETNLLGKKLHIYSCTGDLVLQKSITSMNTEISIDMLSGGIYFLKLDGQNFQKLIKNCD